MTKRSAFPSFRGYRSRAPGRTRKGIGKYNGLLAGAAALMLAILFTAAVAQAQERETRKLPASLTTTVQTGFTDNFQLTLGGTFGGTAWANRVESAVGNAFSDGDALFLYGADSMDVQAVRNNWQVGAGYRRVLWRTATQQLAGSAALQHWKFSSVKQGTNDWLSHENLTYRNAATAIPFTISADSWNLYSSPLPNGSILHTQLWAEHGLWMTDKMKMVFRHGPAHTVGLGFYGAEGNRVFRYQAALGLTAGDSSLEGGFRRQKAFQPNIPENGFWHVTFTRRFRHR